MSTPKREIHSSWLAALPLVPLMVVLPVASAETPVQPLADSVLDYRANPNQGSNGWEYGFYNGNSSRPWSPRDFEQLTDFNNGVWWQQSGPTGSWTFIADDFMHSNTRVSNPDRISDLQWAARRWTSSFTGEVVIRGELENVSSNPGGDGTQALIYAGDNIVFTQLVEPFGERQEFELSFSVTAGQTIDFVLAPNQTALSDGTLFTAQIWDASVPAPAGAAVLGLGGLAATRRRR